MQTRRVLIGCDFTYVAEVPTPTVFQVLPIESPHASIEGAGWVTDPAVACTAT
jgi:hypothetical protein